MKLSDEVMMCAMESVRRARKPGNKREKRERKKRKREEKDKIKFSPFVFCERVICVHSSEIETEGEKEIG